MTTEHVNKHFDKYRETPAEPEPEVERERPERCKEQLAPTETIPKVVPLCRRPTGQNDSGEGRMSGGEKVETWVVYLKTMHRLAARIMAVCTESEWAALELAQPGAHTLVQRDVTSEGEAERLARGTSGDPKPRKTGADVRETL